MLKNVKFEISVLLLYLHISLYNYIINIISKQDINMLKLINHNKKI